MPNATCGFLNLNTIKHISSSLVFAFYFVHVDAKNKIMLNILAYFQINSFHKCFNFNIIIIFYYLQVFVHQYKMSLFSSMEHWSVIIHNYWYFCSDMEHEDFFNVRLFFQSRNHRSYSYIISNK